MCGPVTDKLHRLLCLLVCYMLSCFQVMEDFGSASISGTEEADGGGDGDACGGSMVQTALDTGQ